MNWSPFTVAFGRSLQGIRYGKRITQSTLAEVSGLSRPFCSAIERGSSDTGRGFQCDDTFVTEVLARVLKLEGLSEKRFALCFVLSREFARIHQRKPWEGAFVSYSLDLLNQEPELGPVFWPVLRLARKHRVTASLDQRIRLVEEAEIVDRLIRYITVYDPPLSVQTHIPAMFEVETEKAA